MERDGVIVVVSRLTFSFTLKFTDMVDLLPLRRVLARKGWRARRKILHDDGSRRQPAAASDVTDAFDVSFSQTQIARDPRGRVARSRAPLGLKLDDAELRGFEVTFREKVAERSLGVASLLSL